MNTVKIPTEAAKLFTKRETPYVIAKDRIVTIGNGEIEFSFAVSESQDITGKLSVAWHDCAKAGLPCEVKEYDPLFRPSFTAEDAICHSVNAGQLKWALLASDDTATRFVLNSVAFSQGGAMVATDGRRMHVVGGTCDSVVIALVPAGAAKLLLKLVKPKQSITFRFVLGGNCCEAVLPCGTVATIRLCEGRYPKWEDVLPKCEHSADFTAPTKAEMLVAKAEAAVSETSSAPSIRRFDALFSAEFLDDIGEDCVAQWGDPFGAYRFDLSGLRIAVVMPMNDGNRKG